MSNIKKFVLILVGTFFILAYLSANDDIIGYTEHGIPVTKDEVQVRSISIRDIRTWKWIDDTETLRLTLNRNKKVDIKFATYCWDIDFATGLEFRSFGGLSTLTVGDRIIPVNFYKKSIYPCYIRSITEVIEEKKDGEEN